LTDIPIKIRGIQTEDDRNFIIASWIQTFRGQSQIDPWMPRESYIPKLSNVIKLLIHKKPEIFRIACNEENDDQAFGWACSDRNAVYFAYVKKDFRRYGVATELIGSKEWTLANWTKICEKMTNVIFEPSHFKRLIHEADKTKESSITRNLPPSHLGQNQENAGAG